MELIENEQLQIIKLFNLNSADINFYLFDTFYREI